MSTNIRHAALSAVAILALAACQNAVAPKESPTSYQSEGITLTLNFVDFAEHSLPNLSGARILDPSAKSFRVTVTGPGIASPIVQTFTAGNDWNLPGVFTTNDYTSGGPVAPSRLKTSTMKLTGIPTGPSRQIFIEGLSTALPTDPAPVVRFSGSTMADISLNSNFGIGVNLVPRIYTEMTSASKITGIAPSKQPFYYRLSLDADNAWYLVSLKSAADVDLYVSSPSFNWYWSWFQQQNVNEGVMIQNSGYSGGTGAKNYWYVAVYNASDADASFSLQATKMDPKSFSGYNRETVDPVAAPFASILADSSGVQELMPSTFGQFVVNLNTPFVYNGTSYDRIYVSPNGYVTFWPYGFWYDWWYWTSPLAWWGSHTSPYSFYVYNSYFSGDSGHWWSLGSGSTLPNELIALGKRPFFCVSNTFDSALPADKVTRIMVKQDTVSSPDNKPLSRVTVEFHYLYAWYGLIGGANTNTTKFLSGQIVLTENPYSPSYDGTIDLRYDRANSDLSSTGDIPFIGLENNVGDPLAYPNQFSQWTGWTGYYDYVRNIPARDIRFSSMLGGISIGAE